MEKDNRLTYIDEEGNEVLCEILFTFDSEEFKKSYVLFYPVGSEQDEEVELMAAAYVPDENGIGELCAVETDEEWELIEETLHQFDEEYADDDECGCDECDCEECEKECDDEHECHCGHCHHNE